MGGVRRMSRGLARGAGFTLVEVLVALVLVQVGVLGLAGSLLLSTRTLRDARLVERRAADLAWVHDSLAAGWSAGEGETRRPWGWIRWTVTPSGRATLLAVRVDDTVRVDAWLPRSP